MRGLSFVLVTTFALGCDGAAPTVRNEDGSKAGPRAITDDQPSESGKLQVKVEGKELSISGKKVSFPGHRQELIGLLGEPSRVLKKANTILVWDELGVFVHERPSDGPVFQFSVALGDLTKEFDFWPKKTFTGKLSLDGAAVTARATIDGINRAKKGNPLRPDEFLNFRSVLEEDGASIVILKAKGGRYDVGGFPAEFLIEIKPEKEQ